MTVYSPILALPEVDPNQNQKESTIVTAQTMLEAAAEDTMTIALTTSDVTLTALQWTTAKLYVLSGATVDLNLFVPATKRFVSFENTGTASILVQVTGGAGLKVPVQSGTTILAYCDGTNLLLIANKSFGNPRTYTASHLLTAHDGHGMITMNSATATVLSIPEHASLALPIGVPIPVYQKAAGQVLITVTGSNATLHWPSDHLPKTRKQDSMIFLLQTAADSWVMYGDLG